jgi:hypothetical protein
MAFADQVNKFLIHIYVPILVETCSQESSLAYHIRVYQVRYLRAGTLFSTPTTATHVPSGR